MKIKLFTHTDFDGIGCSILGILAFGKENVDIEYCDYININNKVKNFILDKEYDNYDYVYITDISVNQKIADLINDTHPDTFKEGFNLGEMFQLLDHHETAKWLNEYHWANVTTESYANTIRCSGTFLLYIHLLEDYLYHKFQANLSIICDFVEIVRQYDTGEWKTKNNDIPKKWNDLFYILGRYKFIDTVFQKLSKNDLSFNSTEKLLLELATKK